MPIVSANIIAKPITGQFPCPVLSNLKQGQIQKRDNLLERVKNIKPTLLKTAIL
jgi:hypothetical protein